MNPFLFSLLITLFSPVLFSQTAFSEELNKRLVNCVLDELVIQYPVFEDLELNHAGSIVVDQLNWDLIVLTQFRDGATDRFFISVKEGNYSNALLLIEGLKDQTLDLHRCLRYLP